MACISKEQSKLVFWWYFLPEVSETLDGVCGENRKADIKSMVVVTITKITKTNVDVVIV
jgi:hypothetical protein